MPTNRFKLCRLSLSMLLGVVFATGSAHAQSDDALLARELANPIANLISVPIVTNYDRGMGAGDGHRLYTNIQPLIPIELSDDWILLSRTIIPITWSQEDIDLSGGSGHQSGFGDITESLFLSPSLAQSAGVLGDFTWGGGAIFMVPTGNSDPLLGTGKWGAGPTAVGLFVNKNWTYGALVNHLWDVGGDAGRSDVSTSLIQPWISYTTANAFTFAAEMEGTYDWVTKQWSLPINLTASKLTTIGEQKVTFEVGLRYWADSPSGGPEDLGSRFNVTFLFPR